MQIGYVLVLDADSHELSEQQYQALYAADVTVENIYEDKTHTRQDARPELQLCLSNLRVGDVLVVWQLDRLAKSRVHLLEVLENLWQRGIGLQVLIGQGAVIDTTQIGLKFVIDIIGALSALEATIVSESTTAGLAAARAKGQQLGAQRKMTAAMLQQAIDAITNSNASFTQIASDLGITRATLYNYLNGDGSPKPIALKILQEEQE